MTSRPYVADDTRQPQPRGTPGRSWAWASVGGAFALGAASDGAQERVGRAPSATTQSWSSIESSLLTGETAPRCTVARAPGAGDEWGPKGLKEHVLKEPGGGEGPEGGDARLAPASASACRERASGGALLESS